MAFHRFLLYFGLLLCVNAQYENCTSKLSVLERALYNTDSNERALNAAFFPPREETSRYIQIIYRFLLDDNEEDRFDDCNVSYIWSIGGFLIIQPPSVFMFTSLFFSTPANNLTQLNLTLPKECRKLAGIDGDCSCDSYNNNRSLNLDILSQQILQYSKYNNYNSIVRDDKSSAQAVCTENIQRKFYGAGAIIYLSATLSLPLFIIPYIILFIQNYRRELEDILFKPSNHHHIAAIVVSGFYTSLFILALDLAALAFNIKEKMQYAGCDYCKIRNTIFLVVTLAAEVVFAIAVFYLILVICCEPIYLAKILILNHSKIKTYDSNKQNEAAKLWSLVSFMLIPSWFVSSHIGYVLMSWLTEPSKSTSIALLVMALYLYLYLAIRNWYQRVSFNATTFKLTSLFYAMRWGVHAIIGIGLISAALAFIPLPTVPLGSYIENIAQIFLVLLAALVSYKLISIQESDTQKFLKNFKKQCVEEDIQIEFKGTKVISQQSTFTVKAIRINQNGGKQVFNNILPVLIRLTLTRNPINKIIIGAQLKDEVFQNIILQGEYIDWLNVSNHVRFSPWVKLEGFGILPTCMVITFSDNSEAVFLPPYCTDFVISRYMDNNIIRIQISVQLRGNDTIRFIHNRHVPDDILMSIRYISMNNLISICVDGNNDKPVPVPSFRIRHETPNLLITPHDHDPTTVQLKENEQNARIIVGYFRKHYTGINSNVAILKACLSSDYDNFEGVGNIVGSIASKMDSIRRN